MIYTLEEWSGSHMYRLVPVDLIMTSFACGCSRRRLPHADGPRAVKAAQDIKAWVHPHLSGDQVVRHGHMGASARVFGRWQYRDTTEHYSLVFFFCGKKQGVDERSSPKRHLSAV